ncbi:MAG: AAA family ATPase [Phycisphaeraceae bacterium]|nr:MAG: AAA family ATPase [Phycisphaeraceae bacterium]
MDDVTRLVNLLKSGHRCVRIVTHEESEALDVVVEASNTLGRPLKVWSAVQGLRDWSGVEADNVHDGARAVLKRFAGEARRGDLDRTIYAMLDLADHLNEPETLRALREALLSGPAIGGSGAGTGGQLVLIDHSDRIPATVEHHAVRLDLSLPDEEELEALLRKTVQQEHRYEPIEVNVSKREVARIVANLRGLTRRQARQIVREAITDDRKLDASDIPRMIASKRLLLGSGELLEFVEAPTSMDEIGGMGRLKKWLADRAASFSKEASQFGLTPPRGVLLLGVQGAGKSLCAKAVATAWTRPLLRLDPGVLYDRYVGESERRLREALRQVEAMAPAVLWVDEIEKALGSASGSAASDGGLSRRMFGTMLTWMQEHREPVFLVATANAIDELPPELMRKGRFDEIFFVDLPGEEARRAIVELHLRKRGRDPARFDIPRLVAASAGFSGAEIEQAIVATMHERFAARKEPTTESIEDVMRQSPPLSVTMRERIEKLRAWASGRCVPAE